MTVSTAPPAGSARATETSRARDHMTPESRALFDGSTLSQRLGHGTVAGGLNDQLRFRFDQNGSPGDWKLVPDNKLSAEFLDSRSGARLEDLMSRMLGRFNDAHAKGLLQLRGVMFSDDVQSWAAGRQLIDRDERRHAGIDMPLMSSSDALHDAKLTLSIPGVVQSLNGWMHISPYQARNILTTVGAYTPAPDEYWARSGEVAHLTGTNFEHELHHRVSEATTRTTEEAAAYDPVAWLEEGTATLLGNHGHALRESISAWGVTPQQHAAHVAAPDDFDLKWSPWKHDPTPLEGWDDILQERYVDSVSTIQALLKLSGIDRRTGAGRDRTFELLQGSEVTKVPTRLAEAILQHHALDATPDRIAAVGNMVTGANETGGIEALRAYLRDVGPA